MLSIPDIIYDSCSTTFPPRQHHPPQNARDFLLEVCTINRVVTAGWKEIFWIGAGQQNNWCPTTMYIYHIIRTAIVAIPVY